MAHNRFTVIPAVYVVVRKDNQILLLRRHQTGYMDGMYGLPSGHIDGHEAAEHAAIREAKEEIGVSLHAEDLRFVHVTHRVGHTDDGSYVERVDIYFEVSAWDGEVINAEPHKCDELRWASLDELPDNLTPELAHALKHIERESYYSSFNF